MSAEVTVESPEKPPMTNEEKHNLIMGWEIGSRRVPVIEQDVPQDCSEGFGTWSPIKKECALCPFVASCFCRATNTPPRVLEQVRKPRGTRNRKSKTEDSTMPRTKAITEWVDNDKFHQISKLSKEYHDKVGAIGADLRTRMIDNKDKNLLEARVVAKKELGVENKIGFEMHSLEDHVKHMQFHSEAAEKNTKLKQELGDQAQSSGENIGTKGGLFSKSHAAGALATAHEEMVAAHKRAIQIHKEAQSNGNHG